MPHIIPTLKNLAIASAAALLLGFVPAGAAFADDCQPPAQSQAGVHWPTGSDSDMFTYQCTGDYSGEWLSAHYVFNPSDNSRTPLVAPIYTYDATTDEFDAQVWDYNAAQSVYQLDDISVTNPPAGAIFKGSRPVVTPTTPTTTSGDSSASTSPQTNAVTTAPGSTGSGSTTGITQNGTNTTTVNNGTTVNANTGLISFAGSGNANVSNNTTGGSATSGEAQTIANVINMLQSSSNVLGGPNMITFTANINGDVNGDLLLDPTQLGTIQPANASTSLDNNVTVNNSLSTSLDNTINLDANSGDASVTGNTQGGDATSGNASAVANIVNVLNSYVTAGKSFIGVININGNLNGDILLPPNFVDTLLANNVPHYDVTTNVTNNATVANVNNATVNNNATSSADTGNANVSSNSQAGSATTGAATTKVTVFNLTGTQVIASNDLLVFVNVLGSWYGMIMNAPAGSTAASLGGGVNSNTSVNNDTALNNNATQTINNNVNVKAKSGDATVSGNTEAGNAKTGDASTTVSIANLVNDRISLTGWFGLLFINVFGNWTGSFGINTSAGDPIATTNTGAGASPTFQFIPRAGEANNTSGGTYSSTGAAVGSSDTTSTTPDLSKAAVLAAHTAKASADTIPTLASGHANYLLPAAGLSVAFIILLAGERKRFFHRG